MENFSINNLFRDAASQAVMLVEGEFFKEEDGYCAKTCQSFELEADPGSPGFIPFDELTESDVLSWVENLLTQNEKEFIEMRLNEMLNHMKEEDNRVVPLSGLPW